MKKKVSHSLILIFIIFLSACNAKDSADNQVNGNDGAVNEPSGNIFTNESTDENAGKLTKAEKYKNLNMVLDAKWYEDNDDNLIPNFIESELGYNPNADDCSLNTNCGEGALGEDLDFTVNTLLMLDASGSMKATMGGRTKIEIAKSSLSRYTSSLPETVRMGFMVYGHKGNNQESGKAESCAGVDLLAPIGKANGNAIQSTLNQFQPTGWTPIGTALKEAQKAFTGLEKKNNRIIMVSDGIETCGGDPIAAARELKQSGFNVVVDVIGFGVGNDDAKQLRAIAEAGGGIYYDAKSQAALDAYFDKQREAYMKTITAALCYLTAANDYSSCEDAMMLKSMARIKPDRQLDIAKDNNEYVEFMAFRALVMNRNTEMKKKREQALAKYSQLKDVLRKINNQTLSGYDKIQPQ